VVPVPLVIDGRTYRDGIDITPAEFYTMLRHAKKLPTTSASSPEPYLQAFRNASLNAESVLCLTEPAHFSAMFQSARTAWQVAKETLPKMNIEVVECTTAAAGMGLVALAAARAAAMNNTFGEVKEIAAKVMAKVKLYAALDTLQYLVSSGRVPQAAAMVNSILSIKPVFTLNHSSARALALPRSMKSAISRMLKFMAAAVFKGQHLYVAVMHADTPGEAEALQERIAGEFTCREIYVTEFTPVMGVHTGPGIIGIAFYEE
jgi:DegV family protein with EDD domain